MRSMSSQRDLRAMFGGRREVVPAAEAKAKRGRGHPKEEARAEVEDPALRQMEQEAVHHELLTEVGEVHDPHPQVGVGADLGAWMSRLGVMVGKSASELRIPWGPGAAVGGGATVEVEVVSMAGQGV